MENINFHTLPFPNRSQRNRVGFDSLFLIGWIGSTSVGPLAFDFPPQFVPSSGGGGFTVPPRDDPRLGACAHERSVAYLQMPRLQWPLASRTQPSCTPPGEDPSGTHSGRRACIVPGTASEPQDLHPAAPQPRVSDQPPGGPRDSCVQREADPGWVGDVIGGMNRERAGVLRAPPDCDFRSAPATPDGVCACLSRSFL